MKKKTILILVAVLIFGALVGIIIHQVFFKSNQPVTIASASPSPAPKATATPLPTVFQWGINTGADALGQYSPENWQQQVTVIKDLGAKWVRFSWEDFYGDAAYQREDQIFSVLWQNGIDVILIVQPTGDWTTEDTYQDGYNKALAISTHYKGKIKFYQIANEGDAMTSISPTTSGEKKSDFDPGKYAKIQKFLEGASKGIAEGDQAAQTIISTVGTQTGYLDLVKADSKIKFDIIGLDWYNWCGDIASKKMDDGKTLLSTKLQSFGKPMIFTEVNAWPSADPANAGKQTLIDENLQATFVGQTANWAYLNRQWIEGFYVYTLFDSSINPPSDSPMNFGIYNAQKNSGGIYLPASPRQAFTAYQAIIKKYSK